MFGLSNGQLWSWHDVDRYPLDWRLDANLPVMWDLRGLRLAQVTTGLAEVVRRHEALRTTYHLRDGMPAQRVHPVLPLPVERLERTITDPDEPDRVLADLARRAFPMTDVPGWRGRLITTDDAPMFLTLSFSHLFFDVWSTQHIREHFRQLAVNPDAELPVGPTLSVLAREQRGSGWRARQAGAERYWTRLLGDLGDVFPTLPAREKRPRIEATLSSRRLGGLAASAAVRLRVSGPSVVLAMIVAGLAHYLDIDRVTVSVMASNRFAPEHQRVVGTMNQLIPAVAEVDRGGTVAELVKRVHWASTRAYRHACYDPERIATLVPAAGCWFNHLFRCWFNYLQLDRVVASPVDPAPAELRWTPVAQPYGQAFRVRVAVEDGQTSVLLLADPDILPADAVVGILRGLAVGVERAASDPHVRLSSLWDRVPLDAALFPAEVPAPPIVSRELVPVS